VRVCSSSGMRSPPTSNASKPTAAQPFPFVRRLCPRSPLTPRVAHLPTFDELTRLEQELAGAYRTAADTG
jgi:hypothetical protein